jgi:WD40 repeat protein
MQLLDIIDTIGSPIRHMIISTDDTFIVVACDNNSVQVKSLVTGSDIHNLEGHSTEVRRHSVLLVRNILGCILGDKSCGIS